MEVPKEVALNNQDGGPGGEVVAGAPTTMVTTNENATTTIPQPIIQYVLNHYQ